MWTNHPPLFLRDFHDLIVDDVLLARQIVPGAEDVSGSEDAGAVLHVREQEGVVRPQVMRVVDEEIGFGDTVAELDDFDVVVGLAAHALVVILVAATVLCARKFIELIESEKPNLAKQYFADKAMQKESSFWNALKENDRKPRHDKARWP